MCFVGDRRRLCCGEGFCLTLFAGHYWPVAFAWRIHGYWPLSPAMRAVSSPVGSKCVHDKGKGAEGEPRGERAPVPALRRVSPARRWSQANGCSA